MLLVIQFLLLSTAAAGWGYWIRRMLRIDRPWSLSLAGLLFGAGFAIQVLILQNLVYANLPVHATFALTAIPGWIGFALLLLRDRPRLGARDRNWALGLFAGVYLLQAGSAIVTGPGDFYGKGHTDQFNYVILSEFVLTQPFHSTPAETGLHPWLTRVHEFKNWRLGQSVAQAYVAALSFTHAKAAYAALSAFCVALLALFTYILARSMAISAPFCVLFAAWAGLAPAITRYHLEGFLSQVTTIWVLPYLALWARTTPRRNLGTSILLPAILLSYLLVSYVELLPVGLAVFGALLLFLAARDRSAHWIARGAAAFLASALLVPQALLPSWQFLCLQLDRAQQRFAPLEEQAGLAGTIPGWMQGLAHFPFFTYPTQFLAAMLLIGLGMWAIYGTSRQNRLFLIALAAPPLVLLGYLFFHQPFARYPFAKIQDSFAYLWILVPMVGVARTRSWFPEPNVICLIPGGFLMFAAWGTYLHHQPILHPHDYLLTLAAPGVSGPMHYAEEHPGGTYLIENREGNIAGWLAYHARQSDAYLTNPQLADFPVPPQRYAFTEPPKSRENLTILSEHGVVLPGAVGVPQLTAVNAQEEQRQGAAVSYWVPDTFALAATRWDADKRAVRYQLRAQVEPDPAQPGALPGLRVTNARTGEEAVLPGGGASTVPITLLPGSNWLILHGLSPRRAKLIHPSLSGPQPVDTPVPAETAPQPPLLRGLNPQGEEQPGPHAKFWVAKEMALEIRRVDTDPADHLYGLVFAAQAGFANPNPSRTLRITPAETGEPAVRQFLNAEEIHQTVRLRPGINRIEIALLDNLPQLVKAPNDPRVHMLRLEDFRLQFLRRL